MATPALENIGLTKRKKKHLIRQKVKLFRAKEPLLSVFMWGINHSINELNHINIPVMLMPDDFKASSKIRVDNHMFNKENMPSHFKFKEYCPLVFRNLRERFNMDEELFVNSLTKRSPSDIDSPGRSGARFLTSYDRQFVVKTISGEEVAEMHHILKDYHQYIVEKHAETLLPQYMGMYRITVNDQETYLVVMKNIFSPRLTIHKKFDLKGSTVARQASDKEKAKDLPTFKDNDFVNEGVKIYVGDAEKERLMQIINADVEFLQAQNLMDYSLLVGIHDLDRAEQEQLEDSAPEENGQLTDEQEEDNSAGSGGGAPVILSGSHPTSTSTPPDSPLCLSSNQPPFTGEIDPLLELFAIRCDESCPRKEIYFLAIIDVLTHYGVKKRTAQAAKTVKHGANAEISTVKPEQYAKRFVEFMGTIWE